MILFWVCRHVAKELSLYVEVSEEPTASIIRIGSSETSIYINKTLGDAHVHLCLLLV